MRGEEVLDHEGAKVMTSRRCRTVLEHKDVNFVFFFIVDQSFWVGMKIANVVIPGFNSPHSKALCMACFEFCLQTVVHWSSIAGLFHLGAQVVRH